MPKGVEIHPLDDGRAVGALLARSSSSDVVDAHVVLLGVALTDRVLTGDPADLNAIATVMGTTAADVVPWREQPLPEVGPGGG